MARSSPGVLRVSSILNFIADHPGQSFTLTDLVKALRLSRATCHALLTSLVEVGYLYRASDKNYVLGPALASIGRIAAEHSSPLQVAQPEMRELADRYDAVCASIFRDRDDIVIRDRAASVSNVGWSVPVGTRMRLRAPFGAIFHAWSTPAETGAWLDAIVPPPTAEQRAQTIDGMAFIQQQGFGVFVRAADVVMTDFNPEQTFGEQNTEFAISVLSALDADERYRVAAIVAPVFEARNRISFLLGLSGFTRPYSGAEIREAGERVRESCERVGSFITGRATR